MTTRLLATLALLTALACVAQATTIHVPADYAKIQDALNATVDGDTVLVQPGTYNEWKIRYPTTHAVHLRSTNPEDPSVVASTVIDANRNGTVMSFLTKPGCAVSGFTIQNGSGGIGAAGGFGIYGALTVRKCVFRNNVAEEAGGAFMIEGSRPLLEGCTFIGNESGFVFDANPTFVDCVFDSSLNTGMWILEAGATIRRCAFTRNTYYGLLINTCLEPIEIEGCVFSENTRSGLDIGDTYGPITVSSSVIADNMFSGIWLYDVRQATIRNCLVTGNEAGTTAGGIDAGRFTDVAIENCTITGNTSQSGPGGVRCNNDVTTITNSIIWGNPGIEEISGSGALAVTYSDVAGGWPGVGNIDADPLFQTFRGFNYLLGPTSLCIDAGDPTIQDGISDSHPRWPNWYPNGPRSDMGAYGGPGNASWLVRP